MVMEVVQGELMPFGVLQGIFRLTLGLLVVEWTIGADGGLSWGDGPEFLLFGRRRESTEKMKEKKEHIRREAREAWEGKGVTTDNLMNCLEDLYDMSCTVSDDDPNSITAALRKRLMGDDPDLTKDEQIKIRQFLEAYPEEE
ncbi:Phosphoglucan phosphatase DSP4, chloroplastic [Sarracenia purpurea var. burkii]